MKKDNAITKFVLKVRRMNGEDWGIAILNYVWLTLLALICVIPFLYVLSISFTSEHAISTSGISLIPKEISLEAYDYIIRRGDVILRAYGVSILVTVVGTILGVLITAGMAFALSNKTLPGRKIFLGYTLFSMLFGGGLIPTYLVVKNWLGLNNSLLAMILPGVYGAWNMILMKNFFSSLPDGLLESAQIDGAGYIRIFWSFVLPLSKAIIATIALFMAVGYWNNWFNAFLYIKDPAKYPIMLVLKNVLSSSSGLNGPQTAPPTQSVQMAIVVVVVVPIMLVYPFLQKHFAKGMMIGSIKG